MRAPVVDSPPATLPFAKVSCRTIGRGIAAGVAFGLVVSTGLTAKAALACGTICLDAALFDAVAAMAIGVVTIGPLALLAATPSDSLRFSPEEISRCPRASPHRAPCCSPPLP